MVLLLNDGIGGESICDDVWGFHVWMQKFKNFMQQTIMFTAITVQLLKITSKFNAPWRDEWTQYLNGEVEISNGCVIGIKVGTNLSQPQINQFHYILEIHSAGQCDELQWKQTKHLSLMRSIFDDMRNVMFLFMRKMAWYGNVARCCYCDY